MSQNRPPNRRTYLRAVVAVAMMAFWTLVTFSGFLLWLAPAGPRSGRLLLLLGLTKSAWGDVHFWLAITAVCVTAIHIVIDWRSLCGCVRYLVSVQRGPGLRDSQA